MVLISSACKNDTPTSNVVPKLDIPSPLVNALDAHGGLDHWQSMKTLRYTLQSGDKIEKHQIDLSTRKVRIDTDGYTLGFDGSEVWVTPDLAAFGDGSARFYHNLIFYFFALPYVAVDQGINYEVLPDFTLNDRRYDAIKISYDSGVGDAPEDEYIMHFDKETGIMHLLLYTVTYYSKEKSQKYGAIIFDDWMEVSGLKLPGSFKGYKYEDGQLGDLRYEKIFTDHYLSSDPMDESTFGKPNGAEVDPFLQPKGIEMGIMNLADSALSLPSKKKILKKIRTYLSTAFETPKEAFDHFDASTNEKLNKSEVKLMLHAADVRGLFQGMVAKTMVSELDTDDDGEINWPEFEKDVKKLMGEN